MTGHQAELAEHQLVAKLVAKMVAVAKAKRVVAKSELLDARVLL